MDIKELKPRWNQLLDKLQNEYADGDEMDVDGVLFLVGINELGKGPQKFKKDQKLDVLHVAICTILEPYGYYEFKGEDPDGWPHFDLKEKLPPLKPGQQSILMKEALVNYFTANGYLKEYEQ